LQTRLFLGVKENNILVLKGLAIVGVVFQHILNRRFDERTLDWLSAFAGLFGWCVLLFLATAGWLHSLSVEKREKPLLGYAGARAKRLLLPWLGLILFYSGCWHCLQLMGVGDVATRQDLTFWGKVHYSLLLNSGSVADQLYFLPVLFLISGLLHFVWQGGKRAGVALYVGLAFAAGS
jgi:fucose 4-O-acetylase-like acetyltransferase